MNLKLRREGTRLEVFDPIRKKYVVCTPEEWVRQEWIYRLTEEKNYPSGLLAVERQLICGEKKRRFDLLLYTRQGYPLMIFEFKAPTVSVESESVYTQAIINNLPLGAPFLLISNGNLSLAFDLRTRQNIDINLPDYDTLEKRAEES